MFNEPILESILILCTDYKISKLFSRLFYIPAVLSVKLYFLKSNLGLCTIVQHISADFGQKCSDCGKSTKFCTKVA